jgi:hypothetical protein
MLNALQISCRRRRIYTTSLLEGVGSGIGEGFFKSNLRQTLTKTLEELD